MLDLFTGLLGQLGPTRSQFNDLYVKAKRTSDTVNRNAKIANKNLLHQFTPAEIKPGWLQRAARDQKSWAKPKGWRMRGL